MRGGAITVNGGGVVGGRTVIIDRGSGRLRARCGICDGRSGLSRLIYDRLRIDTELFAEYLAQNILHAVYDSIAKAAEACIVAAVLGKKLQQKFVEVYSIMVKFHEQTKDERQPLALIFGQNEAAAVVEPFMRGDKTPALCRNIVEARCSRLKDRIQRGTVDYALQKIFDPRRSHYELTLFKLFALF